jgi:PqqD family protein of HPr-rel-A system
MTIDPRHEAAPEARDRRWGLPENVGLLWKSWDEEVIVFNQASGQTHLLDALSAEVLRELEQHPRTMADLATLFANRYELDSEELGDRLTGICRRFDELGLAEPVGS